MTDANQKQGDRMKCPDQTLNDSRCGSASSSVKADGGQSPNIQRKPSERTLVQPSMLQCHSASSKQTSSSVDSPLEDDRSRCACAYVIKDDLSDGPAGWSDSVAPHRLILVSSKIRNASGIQQALNCDVVMLSYKYENSTLDNILELVDKRLNGCKVASVAFVLSSVDNFLQLSGKDEKVLSRETLAGQKTVQQFFQNLVTRYLKPMSSSAGIKTGLHFLACAITTHTEMELLAHALTDLIKVPVGVYKHLSGAEISAEKINGEEGKYAKCIGSLYFRLEKLRFWSGQRPQSLAGFEKIRTVGKGAYGAAVLYRKKDDDFLVILKEINMHDLTAAERQMALNEVQLLAMLDHPNIISYYDSFEEDGILMIEMEYADGGKFYFPIGYAESKWERTIFLFKLCFRGLGNEIFKFVHSLEHSRTLAQFLANRDKALEERDILLIFQHIVSAIRYTHEVKILHRDLKTANIFLTKEGVAKVGDFGIAKLLSTSHKGASTVLGTPYYISPEMCESKPYDEKSDIWALGCILYEMACRQKTFEGSNLPALVNKIMKGQFAPVKGDYSQELKDLITSMLQQNPDERPSAHHLLYNVLPKLLNRYEDTTTDLEKDICSSLENMSKKRMSSPMTEKRSVLYYLEISSELFTPVFLPSRIRIRQVAVGQDHVIVISVEKLVYSWGEGGKGQLGHGNTVSCKEPELIESLKGKAISRACCGDGFSAFLSENGIVMTCGDGSKGCLGHGDWNSNLRPRLIETLLRVDILALACGPHHVVAGGNAGVLFSWGCGANGRLGLGTEESHCKPMKIQIVEPVVIVNVHCGNDGSMFLTDAGAVLACGSNRNNKLGLNNRQGFLMAMKNIFNKTEVEGQNVPTPVKSLARFKVLDISMGSHHTAVIVEPGCYVYTFGQNSEGQLGMGNTKSTTGPVKVQHFVNEKVVCVQCGDHFTVACTADNHLYYWGLRFKPPAHPRSSAASGCNKDAAVATSTHSSLSKGRCSSDSCLASLSPKEFTFDVYDYGACGDCNEECIHSQSEGTEHSMDSSNGIQDHSDTVEWTTGFQPISFSQNRSTSATSSEAEKTRDVEEESKIIFPPTPLINSEQASLLLQSLEKPLVLSNFFCHGENLFIQAETMAPPSKRRIRRKRSFMKKESVNSVCMHYRHSASSREGGDEYSSETSEMDSQGTLPTWIKHELADSLKVPDGVLTSEEEEKLLMKGGGDRRVVPALNVLLHPDQNSATEEEGQVNSEGNLDDSRCSTSLKAEETPKNTEKTHDEADVPLKPNKLDKNLTSSTGSDTNTDKSTSSIGNAREKNQLRKSSLTSNNCKTIKATEAQVQVKAKSPFSLKPASQRNSSKMPTKRGLLGRHTGNRGITSLGTPRNRDDVLLEELENMKSEKKKVELQLEGIQEQLEKLKENQEEVLRRKEEKDKPLEDEIGLLKQKLQVRDQEIQEFNKIVQSLKEKVECLQMESTSVRNTDVSEDSSSCASPREEELRSSKKTSKICSLQ